MVILKEQNLTTPQVVAIEKEVRFFNIKFLSRVKMIFLNKWDKITYGETFSNSENPTSDDDKFISGFLEGLSFLGGVSTIGKGKYFREEIREDELSKTFSLIFLKVIQDFLT